MATRKVTITLDEVELEQVRRLVASGRARSVSGFVQHAVATSLADITGWGAMLELALEESGGPLTRAEKAWADKILGNGSRKKRGRKAA